MNTGRTTSRRARAGRRRGPRCTRASALRRLLRLDRLDNLTLLERHRGLADDRFIAVQSGLDVDCGPQVTAAPTSKVQLSPPDRHWVPCALKIIAVAGTRQRVPEGPILKLT